MKKIRLICLLLLIVSLCTSFVIPNYVQAEEISDLFDGCSSLDARSSLAGGQPLTQDVQAAIFYELNSGTMVYSHNPDALLDPSGMNKIMTAMLAIELGDPESTVIVSNTALSSVSADALKIGLVNGEQMQLRDLLYCMMVGSANDAAAVIAEYIAGSQGAFVELMNNKAKELGCTNTLFMNPSGLSNQNQHTTARDLAKITSAALELEEFKTYFAAANYIVPTTNKSPERELNTTNYLMNGDKVKTFVDERVTGGKTGAFSATDRSLICTAESGDARYLSVIMSANGERSETGVSYCNFKETADLLNHVFDHYALRRLLTTEQVLDQFEVIDGENDVAVAPAADLYSVMPNDMNTTDLTYRCIKTDRGIVAPLRQGDVVGSVQVWYGSLCVSQSELIAMHNVERPGTHNIVVETGAAAGTERVLKNTLLIIGIVVLVPGLIIGVVIFIRKRSKKMPKKKKGRG